MAAFSVNSLGLFCINTWIWKRQGVQTQNITAAAEKSILYYILHVLSLSLKEQKIVKLRVAQLLHLSIHMYKFFLYEWLLAGWSQWAKKINKKKQSTFNFTWVNSSGLACYLATSKHCLNINDLRFNSLQQISMFVCWV